MIIPNKIKKLIEDNFTNIDQWQTNIAVFISWTYESKDYCLSYSDLLKKYIISEDRSDYFKCLNNVSEVMKELKRKFNLNEERYCE